MLGSTISFPNLFQWPSEMCHMRITCRNWSLMLLACCVANFGGCKRPDPVVTYTVPTKLPAKLVPGQDRMLAACCPRDRRFGFSRLPVPRARLIRFAQSSEALWRGLSSKMALQNSSELPDWLAAWREKSRSVMRRWTSRLPINNSGSAFHRLPLARGLRGMNRCKTM